ncbi:hypothetical protein EUGRSUZ_J00249 [Eucalyptus grandis]|uniref:Uncharacterized protein n=2 Tax=Eucalyptus grandis TaxID=71139 RepID=A0ACC3J1A1_EUCGR|nr:hypothetical protein EUGRSUZ_J00249 [Eucalyptus grandis]
MSISESKPRSEFVHSITSYISNSNGWCLVTAQAMIWKSIGKVFINLNLLEFLIFRIARLHSVFSGPFLRQAFLVMHESPDQFSTRRSSNLKPLKEVSKGIA